MSEKPIELFYDRDPELHLYVYRVVGGQRLKPALFHSSPFPRLYSYLRDSYGDGDFDLFIRRGTRLELAGRETLAPQRRQ